MQKILRWVSKNRQWVFSGIGVAILSALVSFIFRQPNHESHSTKPSSPPPCVSGMYAPTPLPSEIVDELDATPPYQVRVRAPVYSGLSVRWLVTFDSLLSLEGDNVKLMLRDRGQYPWIYTTANLSVYPRFKILRSGTKLWVCGTIALVEDNTITLQLAGVDFEGGGT